MDLTPCQVLKKDGSSALVIPPRMDTYRPLDRPDWVGVMSVGVIDGIYQVQGVELSPDDQHFTTDHDKLMATAKPMLDEWWRCMLHDKGCCGGPAKCTECEMS